MSPVQKPASGLIAGFPAKTIGLLLIWSSAWVTSLFILWLTPPLLRGEAFAILAFGLVILGPLLGFIAWSVLVFVLWALRGVEITMIRVALPVISGWGLSLATWFAVIESNSVDLTRFTIATCAATVGAIGSMVLLGRSGKGVKIELEAG